MNIPESTEDNMDHEAVKAEAKTKQILKGHLEIDLANGTATFTSGGFRVLRITHLPDPVPRNASIDIVALPALTSYTPIELPTMPDAPLAESAEGYSHGGKSNA